ncbi:MAG: hypothetical protein PUG65_01440 [Firmicutes bacterium]|nr:hypothetical protein [Bacillota bacterium]
MKLLIKQKYFTLPDDFSILDENQQTKFKVKGEWSFFKKETRYF